MTLTRAMLAAKFEAIFPHLDERQRRLLMGAEARALGHGGIRLPRPELAELFGVVTGTIAKAEHQARPLLEQHGHQIKPAPAPIQTLAELTTYASANGVELTPKAKPAR